MPMRKAIYFSFGASMAGLLGLFFLCEGPWQLASFGAACAGLIFLFSKASANVKPAASAGDDSLAALLILPLRGLSGKSHSLMKAIESDLHQMQSLLQDASEKLVRCFSALDTQIWALRALIVKRNGKGAGETQTNTPPDLGRAKGLNGGAEEKIDPITRINRDIQSSVNGAVVILQFEDLTAQLMVRLTARVQDAKIILDALHQAALELDALSNDRTTPTHERRIRVEETIKRAMALIDTMEMATEVKSVLQHDMNVGSVELF